MLEIIDVPMRDPMAGPVWSGPRWLQRMKEDVRCVRLRDPAARGEWETLLTYPGVHAVIWHRLAHGLWRSNWRRPARLISWLSRFLKLSRSGCTAR